ncbi:MAG: histidine triad nucleotide-binding protein [Polyangiaceae bacterium]|nr:histidine triad nucleotide-binding protein [Polyangiaceae bacterium]
MSPPACIFCRIAKHEIPARVVLEDDDVIAFHDLSPQAPVHALVIPKAHVVSLDELTPEHGALHLSLLQGARRVARELGLTEGGYRVVANTGRDGGQSVFHLHLHVLGGRPLGWPPG